MTKEICVCKHSKEVHDTYEDFDDNVCYSCIGADFHHEFKMDNLNTIEYIVESKGLL